MWLMSIFVLPFTIVSPHSQGRVMNAHVTQYRINVIHMIITLLVKYRTENMQDKNNYWSSSFIFTATSRFTNKRWTMHEQGS